MTITFNLDPVEAQAAADFLRHGGSITHIRRGRSALAEAEENPKTRNGMRPSKRQSKLEKVAQARRSRILEVYNENPTVKNAELAEMFGCAEGTIGTDIRWLRDRSLIPSRWGNNGYTRRDTPELV